MPERHERKKPASNHFPGSHWSAPRVGLMLGSAPRGAEVQREP